MPGAKRSHAKSGATGASQSAIPDTIAAYLRRPYARLVIPETDGTYRGEILEFPGCIATGDTSAEALDALEETAAGWLEAAIDKKQTIPNPIENTEFSGRLLLRMPKGLHKKAARIAEYEGVSLNQFIITSLAEQVGERTRMYNEWAFVTAATVSLTSFPDTMAIPAQSRLDLRAVLQPLLAVQEAGSDARS
jgi:predicted RNase H-like HicB family nuclease